MRGQHSQVPRVSTTCANAATIVATPSFACDGGGNAGSGGGVEWSGVCGNGGIGGHGLVDTLAGNGGGTGAGSAALTRSDSNNACNVAAF